MELNVSILIKISHHTWMTLNNHAKYCIVYKHGTLLFDRFTSANSQWFTKLIKGYLKARIWRPAIGNSRSKQVICRTFCRLTGRSCLSKCRQALVPYYRPFSFLLNKVHTKHSDSPLMTCKSKLKLIKTLYFQQIHNYL